MRIQLYILLFLTSSSMVSCKKYLDKKNNNGVSYISTLRDVQLLLDNFGENNQNLPYYGECSADNFYFTDEKFTSALYSQGGKDVYLWGKHPFDAGSGSEFSSWNISYKDVSNMNILLETLDGIEVNAGNQQDFNNAKGQCLFFRSWYFWKLVTTFSKAYNEPTADADLGIPLRLTSNFNEKTVRPSVRQTYSRIVADLLTAVPLLASKPLYNSRPSKWAAYALLANTYLCMGDYAKAGVYADSSLLVDNDLIDFNTLNASASFPIISPNPETSFYIVAAGDPFNAARLGFADTVLYSQYSDNDLRKSVFFKTNTDNTYSFKGSYSGSNIRVFTGLSNDEMYLVRAECAARAGNAGKAMDDLNILLKNRMVNTIDNPFVPLTAASSQDALQQVLTERRKELIFRDLRWMDIKRLNLEGANIILTRKIDGQMYTLQPNDNRYAIPLPESVIKISGVPQNP